MGGRQLESIGVGGMESKGMEVTFDFHPATLSSEGWTLCLRIKSTQEAQTPDRIFNPFKCSMTFDQSGSFPGTVNCFCSSATCEVQSSRIVSTITNGSRTFLPVLSFGDRQPNVGILFLPRSDFILDARFVRDRYLVTSSLS